MSLSCDKKSKDQDHIPDQLYKLTKKDYHFLPIDTLTSVQGTRIVHFNENGKNQLYLLNLKRQCVQVYDWTTKKLIKRIQLENEGPNGVGDATSLFVNNEDTLFILSSYNYRLTLLDRNGKLIRKYLLLDKTTQFDTLKLTVPIGGYSALPPGNNGNPLFKEKDVILLGAMPNIDPVADTESFFKGGKSVISFNLKLDKISFVVQYSKSYLTHFMKGYYFPTQYLHSSMFYSKDKHAAIMSYPADENLYVTDLNTQKTNSYSAPSKFFDKIKLLSKRSTNPRQDFDFVIKNHHYDEIHYDPYSKMYLRYVLHPNPKKVDEFDGQPWMLLSVILLDDKFSVVGETMLEEGMPGGVIFFCKDGIYMQKYNKNEEDNLTFVRYEISKF